MNVFVSYSHSDAYLVTPIVKLLRVLKGVVFQDIDSIALGKKWPPQIQNALQEADLVIVFWCSHSARSAEVKKEYKKADEAGKDILPVLLDETPVSKALAKYPWVDFREIVGWLHQNRKYVLRSGSKNSLIQKRGMGSREKMASILCEEILRRMSR